MSLSCNGVFEGGGVRGIGLAGAVSAMEERGYKFELVAGTSAGAIVAALIAAGYSSIEIQNELQKIDFLKFRETTRMEKLGTLGHVLSIAFNFGIYKTDYFEEWIKELLGRRNKVYFKDLKTGFSRGSLQYKLQVIASDISHNKMLVLPDDLKHFGINPDEFPIATAVTMSMSIPLYYKPYRLRDGNGKEHVIVDGGLLSNYPVWLLDDVSKRMCIPTFGFKFIESGNIGGQYEINNIVDYSKAIVSTLLDAHDNYHISKSKGYFQRTIPIPTTVYVDGKRKNIKATYFDITKEESSKLYNNGKTAAQVFLNNWDFERWKSLFEL